MIVRTTVFASQDYIRGAVRLRSASRRVTSLIARSGRGVPTSLAPQPRTVEDATFTIVGDSGRSVSIAVPGDIELARLGGSQLVRASVQTDVAADWGTQILTDAAEGGGILSFVVRTHLLIASNAIAGDYRGVLAATVQYD